MTKTYVDNSYNRSLGRVGMEHGSMVVSRSSSGGGSGSAGASVSSGSSGFSSGGVSSNNYGSGHSFGGGGDSNATAIFSSGQASSRFGESSPKTYVDNSYNRSLGRVGLEHGSMVVSRGSSGGGSGSAGVSVSSGSSGFSSGGVSSNTYGSGHNFGGGGDSNATAMFSGGQASSRFGVSSPKTYVDNSYNRSLGRVGLEHGSMVVSRGSSGRGNGSGGAGVSSGAYGFSSGGLSSNNYGCGSSSGGGGVHNETAGFSGVEAFSRFGESGSRTSYSRSLGRAGMEHGSLVVSRESSSSGRNSSGEGSSSRLSEVSNCTLDSPLGLSSSKTNVDNSYNRRLGRAGMPAGSMVVSSGSSNGETTTKVYADNSYNRGIGRVGMEHGTMVVSKSDSSRAKGLQSPKETYVDNAYNRRIGRVGMEKGTMVVSKKDTSQSNYSDRDSVIGASSIAKSPPVKVYKDNPFNRKLGRVGKPLGTAVHSPGRGKSESGASTQRKVYVDNSLNRSLGRVGKPRGSMPSSRKSKQVQAAQDLMRDFQNDTDYGISYDTNPYALEIALCLINRNLEEMTWAQEQNENKPPKTKAEILEEFSGDVIQFEDIELGRKIGQGGFGDVYFARWKGSVVAVKKLRLQRVSKRRLQDFMDEITIFCELDHPCIVKFIGASTKTPNLSIVMEYMPMSLFDALHMNEEIDFSEGERLQIIRQTCSGLEYLHERGIAHCDLKSQNVLLDYVSGETCVAKITDFGLAMIKANRETSVSGSEEFARNVGTPRYSAPEVLRGERLSARDMMLADAYSLSLIIYEVILEEEPFYDFTYSQLRKHVGEKGEVPEFPNNIKIDDAVQKMIRLCWSFNPRERPIIKDIDIFFKKQYNVYIQ